MRTLIGLAFLAPLALAAAAPAAAGTVGSPACQRDLLVTESALRTSKDRLDTAASGSDEKRCAAWRKHVDVLRQSGAVFARCTTGREKDENVGQMTESAADFEGVIRQRCGGK